MTHPHALGARKFVLRSSTILLLVGLALAISYLLSSLLMPPGKGWDLLRTTQGLFTVALIIVGGLFELFHFASRRSFEWMIAWRYLRVQHKRSWSTFAAGLLLVVLGLAVVGVHLLWDARLHYAIIRRAPLQWGIHGGAFLLCWLISWRIMRRYRFAALWALAVVLAGLAIDLWLMVLNSPDKSLESISLPLRVAAARRLLEFVALGFFVVAHWVLLFGLLMLYFSLFTTISIFSVFLGLEALVAVLSIMGGFEEDLRHKILGATSHVVISKPDGVFSDYRRVLKMVSQLPRVKAAAPYLESEVMITSQNNLSGVSLRGVDPSLVTRVTDLQKFLSNEESSGRLSNLVHPERLAKIPEARFRPMVTEPLGPEPKPPAAKKATAVDAGGPSPKATSGVIQRLADQEADGGIAGSADGGSPADNKTKKVSKTSQSDNRSDRTTKKRSPPGPGQDAIISSEMWDVEEAIGKKVSPRPVYPGIIIGSELAKNLRLYVGDDVTVVAPLGGMSPAGPIPKSKAFRVAGIFYSGLYEYDTKIAYVTIPAAQQTVGLGDEISGIEIKVGQLDDATRVAAGVNQILHDKGYQIQDWQERNVNLFSALKLEKLVMFIVLIFIVLVASFSIVTNLNMVVLEKIREIAALKAMGAANISVLKIFLYAGLYIGTIGTVAGLLSGMGICVFLAEIGLPLDPEIYYISVLPVRINAMDMAIVAVAGVTLSVLATLYPSIFAARFKPVDTLRRQEI